MDKYAIIENNIVNNIVNVDTSLTENVNILNILNIFFNNKLIVKQCNSTGKCYIGSIYKNNIFIEPSPFKSWILVGEKWVAPKEYPQDNNVYFWEESKQCWEPIRVGINE